MTSTARIHYSEMHRKQRATFVRLRNRKPPADTTPVCRLVVFGRDDGAEQGRTIQDIIEADMTAEQFQRHFMGPGALARCYGAGEYKLARGFYIDGAAVWLRDVAADATISRFGR